MGVRINQLTWTLRVFYEIWVLYWFCPKWERLLVKAQLLRGDDQDARTIEMGQQALGLVVAQHGPDHPDVAKALLILACFYETGPRELRAETETLLLRALKIQERAFGPDDPRLVEVLSRLAMFCRFHDQPEKADAYLGRAVTIREKALGPDHPDVAEFLNRQAICLRGQREDYAAAEALIRRALEIYEKFYGPNHRRVWASLGSLAKTLAKLGRHEEAESLYLRSLETAEHFPKPDPFAIASSLDDLAGFYREQGRHEEAEAYCRRAMVAGKKRGAYSSFLTANRMRELAESLDEQGHTADADRLYDEILEIDERDRDDKEYDFRRIMYRQFELDQKHPDRAERLLKRLLALREESLGPKHPGLAPVLEQLGDLYRDLQRYDEAEAYCTRALAMLEDARGPNHPDTADCLNHLAWVYEYQKQYDKAEPLLLRILEIRKSAVAADRDQKPPFLKRLMRRRTEDSRAVPHRRFRREDVPQALEHLANNCRMQKDFAGSALYFTQSLAIQEQWINEGHKHFCTDKILNELANLHIEQRQYAQADALLERADSDCQGDFDVAMAHYSRAHLYEEQGEFERASEVYQNILQTLEQGGAPPEWTEILLKDMARFYRVAEREVDAVACEQRAAELELAKG